MSDIRRSVDRGWLGGFWLGAHNPNPWGRLACGSLALAFLAFPLSDLASGRLSAGDEIAAASGLTMFAAVFLRLLWILPWAASERRAESNALLGALTALAISLAIAFGDEWLGLLVYLSVAAALALPLRLALPGVIAAAAIALPIAGGVDSGSGLALQALMFGLLIVAVRRLIELVTELEAARGQVADLAVSEERLRLSRDMHDLLGHSLSVIALKSELARKLIEREPAAAAREVRDVESVARESLQEARAAVRGLRRVSLAAEIDRAREALEAAGIAVTVRTAGPLPAGVEALLGFAVREGTTNVIRHSRASHCELSVRGARDVVELEVRDDGVGRVEASGDGSGLRGLAERTAEAGGTLDAGAAPSGGFRLIVRLPMPGPAEPRSGSGSHGVMATG